MDKPIISPHSPTAHSLQVYFEDCKQKSEVTYTQCTCLTRLFYQVIIKCMTHTCKAQADAHIHSRGHLYCCSAWKTTERRRSCTKLKKNFIFFSSFGVKCFEEQRERTDRSRQETLNRGFGELLTSGDIFGLRTAIVAYSTQSFPEKMAAQRSH